MIELLGPQESRDGLAHDVLRVGRKMSRYYAGIKFIRLTPAVFEDLVEGFTEQLPCCFPYREPKPDRDGLPRRDCEGVMGSGLRAGLLRIPRAGDTMHDEIVERIFDIARAVPISVE